MHCSAADVVNTKFGHIHNRSLPTATPSSTRRSSTSSSRGCARTRQPEFADWVWDSRRALAIQGEDENFRRDMVKRVQADDRMHARDHGIQVIMFTHQSGAIWADMANIVWASGLQVTAAWYVVTETDSTLRGGSNVKGTVLLVCRKREGENRITRDDLGVGDSGVRSKTQVAAMTGLNQEARGALPRRERVRGRRRPDGRICGSAADPHPLRSNRRSRHGKRGHPARA